MTVRTASTSSRRRRPLWTALGVLALVAVVACALLAWQQNGRSGPAHVRQGQADLAAGRVAQAEQGWRQGIQNSPTEPQCYVLLGDLLMQQRRFPEAFTIYTAAVKLSPHDGPLFLKLNRAALAVNDVPAARAAAKRAADLLPNDADAVGLYGLQENKARNWQDARSALSRAHSLHPDDPDYLHELVRAEMAMEDLSAAERDLTPWLTTHPQDAWACHLMAALIGRKPRTPQTLNAALQYELRAWADLPDNLRVCSGLGDLYLSLNRPSDALKIYQKGLQFAPHSEDMLHGLFQCYQRTGQSALATQTAATLQTEIARHQRIDHLQDLLKLDPADLRSGVELARLQEEDGDDGAAYDLYVKMVNQSPADPRPRRALSGFYRRHNRPGLARQVLQTDFMPPDAH